MVKVITYGTYDLLHYGHIKLLERAKALGDYLIVGVTADDFDRQRGKINVQQTLEERVAAVKATGIADKIIVEEYEGQKIDDIKRYEVDIFTVGSDWEGYFDYLNEFCKVVYLPRTQGVSSSDLRAEKGSVKIGMLGYSSFLDKVYNESKFVNAVNVTALCSSDFTKLEEVQKEISFSTDCYGAMLDNVDAVYIHSHPTLHYDEICHALKKGKHVLCESPIALQKKQYDELIQLAEKNNLILMEAIRTAYMLAYSRLLLIVKSGKIGKVVSVDATCTSLRTYGNFGEKSKKWGSMEGWGPTALLPIFQILGTDYTEINFFTVEDKSYPGTDAFTKVNLNYPDVTATIKVGTGVKSEGELIVSGTKGYIYVPAPWWKTDYFEVRYENPENNKRQFYQLEGDGIRYELVEFAHAIQNGNAEFYINRNVTKAIVGVMEKFRNRNC
ncbi:Gfo/Idh/MocA family oxidoreductase [Pseudoramibacter porci]|uniref:Adenylyltransferase/cytidyltransferase family protein n=1 Tax=Pseudoramibacter porci TaxID=2606631 RepID=A0A7X2NGM8_9FIRM|nr:Gfo/Idh/MocA family oxidoreductase [Pseudoramibacter porci]MSS20129.1 adenylyltransferase/cytidyltransferase family protein [Pseudoramibacter porci]